VFLKFDEQFYHFSIFFLECFPVMLFFLVLASYPVVPLFQGDDALAAELFAPITELIVLAPELLVLAPELLVLAPELIVLAPERIVLAPERIVVAAELIRPIAEAIIFFLELFASLRIVSGDLVHAEVQCDGSDN